MKRLALVLVLVWSSVASAVTFRTVAMSFAPEWYYRLDETSGTTFADQTGTYAVTITSGSYTLNQTGLLAGDSNAAIIGANGATVACNSDNTSHATSGFSLFLIVNRNAQNSDRQLVLTASAATNGAFGGADIASGPGGVRMSWPDTINGFIVVGTSNIPLNTRMVATATFSGNGTGPNNLKMYQNGLSTGFTGTINTLNETTGLKWCIGIAGVGNPIASFVGETLDEVILYPRALTAVEALILYQATLGGGAIWPWTARRPDFDTPSSEMLGTELASALERERIWSLGDLLAGWRTGGRQWASS